MSGSQQLLLGGAPTVTPVDPYFYSVTSLLHGDGTNGGQNNAFLDSSTNNFTITRNGNTTQGSFSPFSQTGWSNYFDGTGDYLTIADNAALQPGGGAFTYEAWVYPLSYPGGGSFKTLWAQRANGSGYGGPAIVINSSGTLLYFVSNAAATNWQISGSSSGFTLPLNQWSHVAIVRNVNTCTIYLNGTAGTSVTLTENVGVSAALSLMAGAADGTQAVDGYMSNFRLVKGTAVYTANFTPSLTPLTSISGTSLLTCQANRFLDASSNAFAITRNGDVSVQPFSPFNPITPYSNSSIGGSGYFDGSGDYLSLPIDSAFSLGTGDCCIEAWIYTSSTAGQMIYDTRDGSFGNPSIAFEITASQVLSFFSGNFSPASAVISGGTVPLGAWTHVAITRSSGTNSLYINGTRVATNTTAWNQSGTATSNWIGAANSSGSFRYFNGYISNFRIVKGSAVYTGATITVPTAPLTAITNTSLLTNFTNGAIFDNAAVADYETVGNAQISTSVKKYGTGSMAFDGTGDYLTSPSNQGFALGIGDFTVEFWSYYTGSYSGNSTVFDSRVSPFTNGFAISTKTSNGYWMLNFLVEDILTSIPAAQNQWQHIAVTRTGTKFSLFVNGNLAGTVTSSNNLTNTTLKVGANYNNADVFIGYIDDLRISKGINRYPYNFTPPTAEFPNIGGTVTLTADPYFDYTTLLLPGNGTNGAQNNTFLDSSTNNFTITRNGNTTQGTFSPFSQTGWGNYFDGTGDYLSVADNVAFTFGNGNFTVECWIYRGADGTRNFIYGQSDGASVSSGSISAEITTGNNLKSYASVGSTEYIATSTGTIPANQWVHIAVVRNGTTIAQYINGTKDGEVAISTLSVNDSSVIFGIGSLGSYVGLYWNGYISNFRLVKGTAVYTANFTPPTTPLTAITNTSLLTCQSNRFIDNSTNAFAITRNGDVSVQAFSPFNPTAAWSASTNGGSGYFDGSGDYLTVPNNTALSLPSGTAFTIEAWIYPTRPNNGLQSGFRNIVSKRVSNTLTTNYDIKLWFNSEKLGFYNGTTFLSSANILQNVWTHFAYVYDGGTSLKLYINGVLDSTFSAAPGATNSADVWIGSLIDDTGTYDNYGGYINSLRIVKGSQVYTSNFTPPSAPLTAITNTQLLTNFTNAGIYDATSKNDLETVGNAQISTTQSKFGGSSMYFDGDDKLVGRTSPNLNMGSGDFTVECWVYWAGTNTSYQNFVGSNSGSFSGNATFFRVWGASVATLGSKVGIGNPTHDATSSVYSVNSIPANTWTHVAATRYNGIIRVFINGVLERTGSSDTSTYDFGDNGICVGQAPWDGANGYYTGYIDDLRITKGIARYTSNFTPPTTAFLTL